ncbi:hypothetical protein ACFSQ7_33005 [Paenibacillus rhizoplanae]
MLIEAVLHAKAALRCKLIFLCSLLSMRTDRWESVTCKWCTVQWKLP